MAQAGGEALLRQLTVHPESHDRHCRPGSTRPWDATAWLQTQRPVCARQPLPGLQALAV